MFQESSGFLLNLLRISMSRSWYSVWSWKSNLFDHKKLSLTTCWPKALIGMLWWLGASCSWWGYLLESQYGLHSTGHKRTIQPGEATWLTLFKRPVCPLKLIEHHLCCEWFMYVNALYSYNNGHIYIHLFETWLWLVRWW